ncbi:MAG TPA: choice-of-anchor tandem repeat GloVer-containing protein [Candidatus Baltobacteraceae bacterium]|jgi:uncharacterized repeat protein (TIGR03803 family)|nr:choice-of-anchor tandem repeat GloVer-containing protein [Candidatus Baltobacteraceae bacterium]
MRVLVVLFCSAALGGCAANMAPAMQDVARSTQPYARERGFNDAAQRKFHTVYSFVGVGEGKYPTGNLIEAAGVFYGTTRYAGHRDGVVFSFTPSGGERVLHVFKKDGARPGALAFLNGVLYGTTANGGANHFGSIFSLTLSGSEHLIYSFTGGIDGAEPSSIVADGGKLYGTTESGGAHSYGTFFEANTSGKVRLLHGFSGGSDGTGPAGPLVVAGHTIYGATGLGGGGPCYTEGCGTVYSVTTSGTEQVLYAFQGGTDGYYPGHLVMMDGTLYGTTAYRGANSDGTVFAVTTSGNERTVSALSTDLGNSPSGLTGVNHKLYGTMAFGDGPLGGGKLFEVTTSGQVRSLHHFLGERGGIEPWGDLVGDGNALYGLTIHGGEKQASTPTRCR